MPWPRMGKGLLMYFFCFCPYNESEWGLMFAQIILENILCSIPLKKETCTSWEIIINNHYRFRGTMRLA